jgi:hypothetical protein
VALIALGAAFVLGTYHGLASPGAITWGDWGYFVNNSAVRDWYPVPSLWSFANLGTANTLGAALAPIDSAMGALARLGVPYAALERLWFYYPAVALSYLGPVALARRLGASWQAAAGAGVFYTVNPYALALISGGQLTVGVGYALFPWVALCALWVSSTHKPAAGLVLGSLVGVQAWYDPRTAGLSVAGIVVALVVLACTATRRSLPQVPWAATTGAVVVFVLMQGPWLLPSLLAVRAHLPAGYTTASALATFSLISLTDGLTLFHPFWPAMRFIALYSVPALWLVVPVVTARSLARDPSERTAQVGTAIYLVFAALVSGSNPPFGFLNTWLFTHVPGMDLFRDPSPYFGPLALGLVLLAGAPATWGRHQVGAHRAAARATALLWKISAKRSQRQRSKGAYQIGLPRPPVVALVAIALVVVSAWPALSGELRHNLAPRAVPARYERLGRSILRAPPGAVLWVPSTSRFAPVSPEHPSVSAFTLEATTGIEFPPVVQGLEWLSVPGVVSTLLERYDIQTVVVRDDLAVYRNLSVPPEATRHEALSSLRTLPGVSQQDLPGLTVFHLPPAPHYPLAIFRDPPSEKMGPSVQETPKVTRPLEELGRTGFTKGLAGWGPLGDGNDYLHQTLAQAGISASVQGPSKARWLHLTVRYGAASIGQELRSCPARGLQDVRVRYRSSTSASLGALVFSATQPPPVGEVALPSTERSWTTASVPFVLAQTLPVAAERRPLTRCLLELSLQPTKAGVPAWADVSSVSLTPAISTNRALLGGPVPSANWVLAAGPRAVNMARTGDRITAVVPPAAQSRLVVLWQRYDPGWVARASDGTTLAHEEVDSWANGFLLPPSAHSLRLEIVYTPQRLSAEGFIPVFVGLAIVALGILLSVARRWDALRRTQTAATAQGGRPGRPFSGS